MIIALNTSTPLCEMLLFDTDKKVAEKTWQAGRQLAKKLPGELEDFLKENNVNWSDVAGVVVFQGPGSFTGLRIGITATNTIAYAQSIPIVGTKGSNWLKDGLLGIKSGGNEKIVLPYYGSGAHITQPRK